MWPQRTFETFLSLSISSSTDSTVWPPDLIGGSSTDTVSCRGAMSTPISDTAIFSIGFFFALKKIENKLPALSIYYITRASLEKLSKSTTTDLNGDTVRRLVIISIRCVRYQREMFEFCIHACIIIRLSRVRPFTKLKCVHPFVSRYRLRLETKYFWA